MTWVEGEIPEKNGEMEKTSGEIMEEDESEEELRKLDRDLTLKSKKLKLSSVNVRNIIHVSLISTRCKFFWDFVLVFLKY